MAYSIWDIVFIRMFNKLLEKLGFVLTETESLSFHKDEHGKDIVFEGGIFIKKTGVK